MSRLAAVLSGILLSGCTVGKLATPAPTSPFLAATGADITARNSRLPFDHSWRSPKVDAASYKTIATVADRRATVSKIADFNQKTLTKANEEILDQWSQQLMEASNKELFPVVRSSWSSPF